MKKKYNVRILPFLLALPLAIFFSGCRDDSAGDELEEAGENMEEAAEEIGDQVEDAVN